MFCVQAHATTTINLDCGKHKDFESKATFDLDELLVTLNFKNKIPQEKTQIRLIQKCLYVASKNTT